MKPISSSSSFSSSSSNLPFSITRTRTTTRTIVCAIFLLAAAGVMAQTNTGTMVRSNLVPASPIHTAAMRGDVEKARALLAENPDLVSSKDGRGWTPLYFAAASGHKDVVELLLANKADINAFNQNFTPLHAAVMNRHPDVADLLIASNAQVTVFDAAAGGYLDILKAQLKTDPALVSVTNNDGWTALHFGARNGHLDVVKLLLANKTDVNVKTRIGMTPLDVAFSFSGSARLGARTTDTNYEAIAELLIANGAEVARRNNTGPTALHSAASAGFTNLIQELLDRKADVNAKDNNGRTPLDLAAEHGHMDVVDLLLARGAGMDAKDKAGLMALKDAEKKVQGISSSSGHEYELDGLVNQTMIQYNGTNLHASASFTVYVRDCGWMIKTVETNEIGGIVAREIGSTNGTETYECTSGLGVFWPGSGQIESTAVPVGQLDSAVVGHLWLMFASQCYWPSLNSDQLVPVYDWHASVGAGGQNRRVSGEWNLLNGPGSLPREVRYLGFSNETNGLYTITGTNSAGGMLFPAGFVFRQFNGDRLIKHVEVEVTAIRPVCSRANLIPLPSKGTVVVDRRFDSGVPNRPPSYQNPLFGQWLTVEESRKPAGINKTNDLRNLARAGISPFPQTRSTLPETTVAPVLSLSIRCTNDVVKAGDEIDIEFRITNRGTNDYKYPNRTYDRSGRMPEYHLVATNSSGGAVPDGFKPGGFGGGGFQYAMLKPGESFTKIIPLNCWALIKAPGQYVVTGTYHAEIVSNNPAVSSGPFITSIPAATGSIAVNVLPRTGAEMDAYIGDLTNQIYALLQGTNYNGQIRPTRQLDDLVMKLMFTCSPEIVPTLLKTMCEPSQGFWEHQALLNYVPHTEETKQAILAAATTRSFGQNWTFSSLLREYGYIKEELKPLIERALAPDNEPGWAVGAGLAQKYPDDAFTERLIAIATTPKSDAQSTAIDALTAYRTDEGVKTLKSLLDDRHEKIWSSLAVALLRGYEQGILRPEDFTAQDMKPFIERMLASGGQNSDALWAVSLIEQFEGDDFTAQLIALANNPGNMGRTDAIYALARNRTDDGLKTLRALLNDADPQIRTTTEQAIRSAYTSRGSSRGRPLKPEDFDGKYQQPESGK